MNAFEKFLVLLDGEMVTPAMYGWFHIMFLAILIVATTLVVVFARKVSEKKFRAILIVAASIMILFEIYKQINFSFNSQTGVWKYQWYAFPFQFCSTPMYIFLIAGLIKKGKAQDALLTYIVTFSLFAGICVMLMPGTVFIETIGINIQTMVHHSLMVIIGFFVLSTRRVKLNFKNFLSAVLVFTCFAATALALDLIVYNLDILNGQVFNMFYISPYFECLVIILDKIYMAVPYPIFLILYVFGFALAAFIVYSIAKLIFVRIDKSKERKKREEIRKMVQ